MRYLKLGGVALAILVAGFLLGSGSIGDIVRTWIAGTGASADQSEVEENRQALARDDVNTLGEAIGVEGQRLNFATAVQCIVLSRDLRRVEEYEVPFERSELLTVEANAEIIALDRAEPNEGETSQQAVTRATFISPSHYRRFYTDGPPRISARAPNREVGPSTWTEDQRRQHDDGVVRMIAQYQSLCRPLLGRDTTQQSGE